MGERREDGGRLQGAVSLALLLLAAPACEDGPPPAEPVPVLELADRDLDPAAVDAAIERALDFFRGRLDNVQVCLSLGALRRRFDLEDFGEARARYDELLRESPPVPDLRALRRVLDPANVFPRELYGAITNEINRLTIPALYCDRSPPPPVHRRLLVTAVEEGGYRLTHVGLALIFMDSLGCEPAVRNPRAFRRRVCEAMAGLLTPEDGVTDLELEAAAFVQALGHGHLVPDEMFRSTLRAQLRDGGWPNQSPLSGDWHTTVMGLWTLLEVRHDEGEKRPLVTAAE